VREAVAYLLALSPAPVALAADLLGLEEVRVTQAVLNALSDRREMVQTLVTRDWVLTAARSPEPAQRAVAAFAVGVRGDEGIDALHDLLRDSDGDVVAAACRSAGRTRNRDYLPEIVSCLASPRVRAAAIEALAGYGEAVCATLGEILDSARTPPAVRHQVPRVLAAIPAPASVEILSRALDAPDPALRDAALRALNRLREVSPELSPNETEVRRRILAESEAYFGYHAALALFQRTAPGGPATALLARTIEARLKTTIERLFHLLELRYQPQQIQAVYLAVSHRRTEEFATALDFLDNVLEHDLKTLLLPMIDGSPHLLEIGRERFGVGVPSLEEALREQILSGDGWLQACSIAAAAELKLSSLAPDINAAARNAAPEVVEVAWAASAALA
jgi:AAA family ATP:ADP antiporter